MPFCCDRLRATLTTKLIADYIFKRQGCDQFTEEHFKEVMLVMISPCSNIIISLSLATASDKQRYATLYVVLNILH